MTQLQTWTVDKPWLDMHCLLGEGPFYEKQTDTVRFVDIQKKQLHRVSVTEGLSSLETLQLDVCPTVTSDIAGVDPRERIALGIKYGLAILDRTTGKYDLVQPFNTPHNERLRGNDGAADPHGRFWLGSMTDFGLGEFQPEGGLFLMGKDSSEVFLKDLTIPNTPGFSPDGKTMYFTHSSMKQILAFDYDLDTGAVTNQRLFYQHQGSGVPDGFRLDVDGNLWTAIFGEGLVLKIAPTGVVVGQVRLPTRNITCVQFVGTELVITTAADEAEDGGHDGSVKMGGAVFRVDVGVRGLDLYQVKL